MVGGAIAHPTATPEPPLITTPLDTIYAHHLRAIIIGCSLRKIGLFSSVTTRLGLDGSLPNRSIQQAQSPSKGDLLPCTFTCRWIGVSAYLIRVISPFEKSRRLRLRGQ